MQSKAKPDKASAGLDSRSDFSSSYDRQCNLSLDLGGYKRVVAPRSAAGCSLCSHGVSRYSLLASTFYITHTPYSLQYGWPAISGVVHSSCRRASSPKDPDSQITGDTVPIRRCSAKGGLSIPIANPPAIILVVSGPRDSPLRQITVLGSWALAIDGTPSVSPTAAEQPPRDWSTDDIPRTTSPAIPSPLPPNAVSPTLAIEVLGAASACSASSRDLQFPLQFAS